jgi:hypothetical protein
LIVAFGKAALPSALRRPPMWSPWKWVKTTVRICAGSWPAARMDSSIRPVPGGPPAPKPTSISTSPSRVRTRVWLKVLFVVPGPPAAAAAATWSSGAFVTKPAGKAGRATTPSFTTTSSVLPTMCLWKVARGSGGGRLGGGMAGVEQRGCGESGGDESSAIHVVIPPCGCGQGWSVPSAMQGIVQSRAKVTTHSTLEDQRN